MQSNTLRESYQNWVKTAAVPQLAFVDSVYHMCEQHYSAGGDTIVECFSPADIIRQFTTLSEVKQFCGLKVEQALNARWGEDDDPEVARHERYKQW